MQRSRWQKRLGMALIACAALVALGLAAGAPAAAVAQGARDQRASRDALRDALRPHRWKHRVLVVVAPTADLPAYREQLTRLADATPALRARDVRILPVLGAASTSTPGRPAELALPTLSPARQRAVRRQLGVADGEFRVVLVGKDGGAKLDRRTPLATETLLETIDAMPMGAAEARRRAGQAG